MTWHSEPFDDRTIGARLAKVAGRHFFLVSAPVPRTKAPGAAPSATDKSIHSLVSLDVDGGLIEEVLLPSVEVSLAAGALEFEALPMDDRLVVVYAAGSVIHEMVGTFVHGELRFSTPQVACQAPQTTAEVGTLRLRAGDGRLHLLWCQGMKLLHASTTGPSDGWSPPETISLTANCARRAEGADLVVDGQDVFIAWSDNRLRGTWDKDKGYDNDLKLFVAGSRDGGATFSTPVLFNDALNKDEQVDRVFLTLANDKVILCWTEVALGSWHTGVLDRGIQSLQVVAAVHNDKRLHEAYTGRMKAWLREVPYTPPRLRTARRPALPGARD